ncbi:patatin-like phospholipase family protein [Methylobrevis pamukkalensis]|uniref:Patatin-like phospholipase n=1 Tax=Methylobrevis pamukkalensis TaxID=1439726 RepID=A0A1E3HA45_9HYPH|nr:patatin-like phospholipase family protein [Methylobrevis pamukkalensis]ODN72636.1 Patatin-like phospholipase [Methylobrevis pamukkalensis]
MTAKNHSGPAGGTGRKIVNLALQGGGAHGAFTWGVLDRLLEDDRLDFEAISGTSAGAMNAVVLAAGLDTGGVDGARMALETFWRSVSTEGRISGPRTSLIEVWMSAWRMPFDRPRFPLFDLVSRVASPYDLNPLNLNPLRDLLAEQIDFERVRNCDKIKLYISATSVETGKIKVFRNKDLSADAVMASACLPFLFHAVEIDGEHYWDGGYMGNPALFPFFGESGSGDIVLVQINPLERQEVPRDAQGIIERVNEITFNASLLRELRAIDFVNRLIDEGRLDTAHYQRNRVHRIAGADELAAFGSSTKMNTSYAFFEELMTIGRQAAGRFLDAHFDAIGEKGTLDLRHVFM